MSQNQFDPVLGRVPSGIYILTVGTHQRATGMLASWVQQAGFDPPAISIALKLGRYVCDWLTADEPFVINVLGEGNKSHLAHFRKGFEPDAPAFEGVEITHSPVGVPVLVGALGHVECERLAHVDSGDHRVFLARIVGGSLADESVRPMVHVRKTGRHY